MQGTQIELQDSGTRWIENPGGTKQITRKGEFKV
jgi:hypothetical protein